MRYLGFSDLNRPHGNCLNDLLETLLKICLSQWETCTLWDTFTIFRIIWPWKHLRPVLQLMYWQTRSYCTYTTSPPPVHTPLYFLHTMCQTECAHTSLIISRNTHLTEHKLLSAVMDIKEAPDSRWERSLRPPFKNELFVLHQQPQTLIETSCLQTREGGGLRFHFQRAVKSFNVKR